MHPIIYQDLARARQADLRAAAVRRERKPRDRMALPRMRRRALAPALSGLKRSPLSRVGVRAASSSSAAAASRTSAASRTQSTSAGATPGR